MEICRITDGGNCYRNLWVKRSIAALQKVRGAFQMKTNSLILFLMVVTAAVAFTPVASVEVQAAPMPPEAPNACTLLSRLEVAEAAGTTVGEGELRLRTATVTRCLFSGGNGGNAAILFRRVPSGDWESEQRGRFQRGVQLGTYSEMPAIGDRAFLSKMGQGSVLCVFMAEYYLQISLFRMGDVSRSAAILEKLARTALTRLRSDMYSGTGATAKINAFRVAAQR